jgi:pimeloyl-ACP methyl ester carboxylesterase
MNTGLQGLVRATKLLPHVLPQAIAQPLALYAFLGNPLPLPAFSTGIARIGVRYVAFGPDATAAQVGFFEQMLMKCPPDVRRGAGIAMADMDLEPALEKLTVPTLVFAGALDRLTPPTHSERIASTLPDLCELVVLPRLGHMGPLETPVEMVQALIRLRERVAAPLAAAA